MFIEVVRTLRWLLGRSKWFLKPFWNYRFHRYSVRRTFWYFYFHSNTWITFSLPLPTLSWERYSLHLAQLLLTGFPTLVYFLILSLLLRKKISCFCSLWLSYVSYYKSMITINLPFYNKSGFITILSYILFWYCDLHYKIYLCPFLWHKAPKILGIF